MKWEFPGIEGFRGFLISLEGTKQREKGLKFCIVPENYYVPLS
jgi:hypothetical protein